MKKQNLMFLYLYWIITNGCFIITPLAVYFIIGSPSYAAKAVFLTDFFNSIFNIKGILLLIFLVLIGCCIIRNLCDFRKYSKFWTFYLCLIAIHFFIIGLIPIYEANEVGSYATYSLLKHWLRAPVLIFLSIFFIWLFDFILFSDKDAKDKERVRERYLQYLSNFIWISGFSLLNFFLIYTQKTQLNEPLGYPRSMWMAQLVIIYAAGNFLVLRAFHFRLRQLEGLEDD